MAKTNYKIIAQVELDTSSIQKKLDEVGSKAISSNKSLKSVGDNTELTFQQANLVMSKSIDLIESMVTQVYNLNAAETEFKKVSDLNGESLDRYVDKLSESGKTVGRTASEMVEAATMFRKNSFNDDDSARLAKVATSYQNVSDTAISAADAASFIISQLKAFNIEAEDAETIIDAVNETANNFSVGTNDLSNALEVSSAGMAVYGNEFSQTIGLITAGTEIMVGRSQQVARGLLTISANIVANKDALAELGIQVEDSNGNLKSTFDVLSELKPLWDNMTDSERQNIGITLAGKNQFKVLSSVMGNFTTAIKANETALNSQGSAACENSRYMESLEAKSNQLKATFQDLANDTISDELVGDALTALNNILETLNTTGGRAVITFTSVSGVLAGLFTLIKQFNIGALVTSPVGLAAIAIGALVAGIIALREEYNKTHKSLSTVTQDIKDSSTSIKENENRINEINKIPWKDRTDDIEAEKLMLEAENKELQRNILLKKQGASDEKQTLNYGTSYRYVTREQQTEYINGEERTQYADVVKESTSKLEAIRAINAAYGEGTVEAKYYLNKIQEINNEQTVKTPEAAKILTEALNNTTSGLQDQSQFIEDNNNLLVDMVTMYEMSAEAGYTLTQEEKDLVTAYYAHQAALAGLNNAIQVNNGVLSVNTDAIFTEANVAKYGVDKLLQMAQAMVTVNSTGIDEKDKVNALNKIAHAAKIAAKNLGAVASGGFVDDEDTPDFTAGGTGGGSGESAASKRRTQMQRMIAYAQSVADKYLDDIADKIQAVNDKYDAEIQALEDSNKELENQLELEQKLSDLEKARGQKQLVFKDGMFQYVSDADAISSAQQQLDTYNREQELAKRKQAIEEQRTAELDALNAEKKRWEEYKQGWSDLGSAYDKEQGKMLFMQQYGIDLEKANWDIRLSNLKAFTSEYLALMGQLDTAGTGTAGSGGGSVPTKEDKTIIVKGKSSKTGLHGGGRKTISANVQQAYASGTTSAMGGMSIVGEQGAELRVLNRGDGVLPADITRNLFAWGSMSPRQFAGAGVGGQVFNISGITLPSVTNAEQFVSGLKRLAMQRAYKRG